MHLVRRIGMVVALAALLIASPGCVDLVTDNVKAGIGGAISDVAADAVTSVFEGLAGFGPPTVTGAPED